MLQKIIDFVRLKKNPIYDYVWNKRIKNDYLIIPIGTFCFPRLIATLCHLKRLKKYGEKTYPFDLAFFRNLDATINLIDSKFEGFYDNLVYENNKYRNDDFAAVFEHDGNLSLEDFKNRYNQRIKNFYDDIENTQKSVIFVLAISSAVEKEQIERLINVIKKYRKNDFKILLMYYNRKNNDLQSNDILTVIDDIDIASINQNDGWANRLKSNTNKNSKQIVSKCKNAFKKVINELKLQK